MDSKSAICKPMDNRSIEAWITKGPDKASLQEAESFGRLIGKDLEKFKENERDKPKDERVSRSQIRQIFTRLKSIESKGIHEEGQWTEFLMLKPYLAYAAKRGGTKGIFALKDTLDTALGFVIASGNSEQMKTQRFQNFCKLFEAILAYHRAFGGN